MIEYLQKTVDYVEMHIDENLSLDQIANYLGFSKFYLNHMFSIYTGLSVMAYVRKKKLEYALDLLKTEKRIVDIAFEVGYASERAFSRAIVNEYGQSPSYFRTHDVIKTRNLVIYNLGLDADEERILSGFPKSFERIKTKIEEKGVERMKSYLSDVRYEVIDKMTVLSGTAVGNEPEEEIIQRMHRLGDIYHLNVLRTFGFDSPVENSADVMQLRGYEYWLSVEESELAQVPSLSGFDFEESHICIKQIPAYRYATLRITDPFADPFERIGTGWRYLVSWLEDRDFKEHDFHPNPALNCLEEVKEVEGVTVMDIYIPIDIK